jgi:hypothetical protein
MTEASLLSLFSVDTVSRETVLKMLKDEEKAKYSPEIQQAYSDQYQLSQKYHNLDRVNIDVEIQKYILRQYGFSDSAESLAGYWKVPSTYWHDAEVKDAVFYMRYNIFDYPDVHVGDPIVDCDLVEYTTGTTKRLSSLQNGERPLVILAGSMT